jgi:cobyrinic acid a,c-diamide synthase
MAARQIARRGAQAADIVIAEGSMGLFDAVPGPEGHTGASADIAALLGWPVVLVIDVSGQAQSAAAIALGCMHYDPRIRIAGVILNKVASERHRRLVGQGMARIGLPVLGALAARGQPDPARAPSRAGAGRRDRRPSCQARCAGGGHRGCSRSRCGRRSGRATMIAARERRPALPAPGRRIAIARDAAFSFVYPHVEAGWRAAGPTLVPFSPLADEAPPEDCDACWLPGGYPELHAGTIAGARASSTACADFAETPAGAWRVRRLHGAGPQL